jgi:putative PEP-CTERM system response regulator
MLKILIVEDETVIRTALRRLLERNGYQISEAGSVQDAETSHDLEEFDLIISDLRLPGAPGTDLISKAGDVPVLIMTSYASLRSAVDSMRMGAVDYIAKPFDHGDMIAAVQRIIADHPAPRQIQEKNGSVSRPKPGGVTGILGNCAAMHTLFEHIRKVSPTDSTVLVLGETGTGKEIVARSVHSHSMRADKIMISVNCAAIPDTLIESELFGYEKGAFTGAAKQTPGKIETAHKGSLFLDEIGDLPMALQAKLLRFLQERAIERLGGREEIPVDVRVVCATHQDLKSLIAQGRFREDLYYRLAEIVVTAPPLRARIGDAALLAHAFVHRYAAEQKRGTMSLMPDAIQAIEHHQWPGNVRELENVLKRAVIMADANAISVADLDLPRATEEAALNLRAIRDEAERTAVLKALARANGNLSKAAEWLGVSRPTLYDLMNRFGLKSPA